MKFAYSQKNSSLTSSFTGLIGGIAALSFLLLPLGAVSAEEAAAGAGVDAGARINAGPGMPPRPMKDARADARADIRDVRIDAKGDAQKIRQEGRDNRAAIQQNATGTRPDLRVLLKDNRQNVVEALKDNAEDRKKAVEARRLELKSQIDKIKAANKDARMKKLDEKAKERVGNKIGSIYKGLEERVARLTKIDAELSARIATAANAGNDTSAAAALLTTAQAALTKAKTDVEATKVALAAEANASTSKEAIRTLVKTAEDSIKAAGEAYKKVVEAVKALPRPEGPATTTPNQ